MTSAWTTLRAHARTRRPALAQVHVRFRGAFAYVTGQLADETELPLCRLRYTGYANQWGFAIYLASKDGRQLDSPAHSDTALSINAIPTDP